jgi:hypothetical protein
VTVIRFNGRRNLLWTAVWIGCVPLGLYMFVFAPETFRYPSSVVRITGFVIIAACGLWFGMQGRYLLRTPRFILDERAVTFDGPQGFSIRWEDVEAADYAEIEGDPFVCIRHARGQEDVSVLLTEAEARRLVRLLRQRAREHAA